MSGEVRGPAEYDAARDRLIAFAAGCSAAALQFGGGRVERFAPIAVRHPDDHRAELEAALGS